MAGRMPSKDWACPVGRGGEGVEIGGESGGTVRRLARGRTGRDGDARGTGAHGARRAPVEPSERTGMPWVGCPLVLGTTLPPFLDKSWTQLGQIQDVGTMAKSQKDADG